MIRLKYSEYYQSIELFSKDQLLERNWMIKVQCNTFALIVILNDVTSI